MYQFYVKNQGFLGKTISNSFFSYNNKAVVVAYAILYGMIEQRGNNCAQYGREKTNEIAKTWRLTFE